ncbi:MAG: ABC transporter permease subunit [Ruthenibacterium lactatiformans]
MDKHSIRVLVHAHRFLLLQHRRQPAGVHGRHEKIPDDLFEAAFVDGATEGKIFRITLPLIADNVKTQFTFWTIGCIGFFLWSRVFSVVPSDPTTITPASYMYDQIFGTSISSNAVASGTNVGMGAAIGVVLCLITVAAMALINLIFPKEKYEM